MFGVIKAPKAGGYFAWGQSVAWVYLMGTMFDRLHSWLQNQMVCFTFAVGAEALLDRLPAH